MNHNAIEKPSLVVFASTSKTVCARHRNGHVHNTPEQLQQHAELASLVVGGFRITSGPLFSGDAAMAWTQGANAANRGWVGVLGLSDVQKTRPSQGEWRAHVAQPSSPSSLITQTMGAVNVR